MDTEVLLGLASWTMLDFDCDSEAGTESVVEGCTLSK
jgi:hypothetical protein